MFGNASQPSINWCYGVKGRVGLEDLVNDQIRAAHRYRNQLVELERTRRERVAAEIRRLRPAVARAEEAAARATEAVESAVKEILRQNQQARRKVTNPRDAAGVKGLRAVLKEARAALKVAKTEAFADPGVSAALDAVDAWASARQKELRAASGLYWGNYLTAEQSMQGSRSGPPPRFRPFRGEGSVAVQIQKGMDVLDALLCQDSRLRVRLLPPGTALPGEAPHEAYRRCAAAQLSPPGRTLALVHLRIGSEGRTPVFAAVPIILHRPLPEGASIKWAFLHKARVATHYKWKIRFVLSRPSGWAKPDRAASGVVAVNPGWRRVEGGLRVATALPEGGDPEFLVIPDERLRRWRKVDDLRSIRDRHFDEVREKLVAWFHTTSSFSPPLTAPDWLRERTETLASWKSPARLAALVLHWRDNRFRYDDWIYGELEEWRKRDKHLYEWEDRRRKRNLRWRADFYRKFAARLRRRFRIVVLGKIDWSEIQRNPAPEDAESDAALKEHMRVSAPGELTRYLKESVAASSEPPAQDITRTCHACGGICRWDQAAEVTHACEHCGADWDQDVNACRNLLRRFREGDFDNEGGTRVAQGEAA